jgi:hypothetical protein
MNIALDYDGTYNVDANMWLAFIMSARASGHAVYIVTMRHPSECTAAHGYDPRLDEWRVRTIATGRRAKKPFCEALGLDVNVWIDDHPQAVHLDADAIWSRPCPEGTTPDMLAA